MNITIHISGLESVVDECLNILSPEYVTSANEYAGAKMRDFICEWYDDKGREHWIRPEFSTHGAGRKESGWYRQLAIKWYLSDANAQGCVITYPDEDGSLKQKINGGTISPKNAKYLTIPLIPEAHGRRARDYADEFGRRLFSIKNKSCLFEAVEGGGVRAVYALKESVTQAPWPDAIPKAEDLGDLYAAYLVDAFNELVK